MSTNFQNNFSHLAPYDLSLEDKRTIYDNQPYKRDSDLMSLEKVTKFSGNVIKYYRFNYDKDAPYKVDTKDANFIKNQKKECNPEVCTPQQDFAEEAASSKDITDEQIESLMEDQN
ncbi:hypothetical protein [Anaeromicropila populeti]|uniref:Uncharacterized protein n=1 Tax=Anaeromicropila populeti TaxID=37658 RepID=A0A1I6IQF4_9FIRM|nr:hypothetical protein [Anaeromicropila populeti]SFR68975.1 hypothetical protein SAMN05661086_01037 [Anaeromicropila populeti]